MTPSWTTTRVRDPRDIPDLSSLRAQFRRRIIVKYLDSVALPTVPIGPLATLDVPGWDQWSTDFPGMTNRGLFEQGPSVLDSLVASAQQQDPSYTAPKLTNYVAINVPDAFSPGSVLHAVRAHPAVERAYVEPEPVPPPSVILDPLKAEQGYLKSSEQGGIDALFAHGFPGGKGEGQTLVDIEWGWTIDHDDLIEQHVDHFAGANNSYYGHGTSVLGIIAAVEGNEHGCIGITPKAASIRCASPFRTDSTGIAVYSVPEVVVDAITAMSSGPVAPFGQVLLLELQTTLFGFALVPVELEPAAFEAIRLATALGIVVVEAAGNGNNDFDSDVRDDEGRFVLCPDSTDFLDSGAILVGQATSSLDHTPIANSARGKRIDCFAWGENIVTLDSDYSHAKSLYTAGFSGTSGASAIVAGAALAVQGLAYADTGQVFGGWQLRDILSDSTLGTPSNSPETDRIGVMPDLNRLIASHALALAPDVYLRDHVGDAGDPHEDWVSASPDVFVVPGAAVADPQGAYGEGSGAEDEMLGSEAHAGRDNQVYVRVRNRGGVDVADVVATVYWAEPASLLDPALLQLVGTTKIANVPADDTLIVSDPIVWPAAAVPATGHYCFVAFVGHAGDPAPEPAAFENWDQFTRFIRLNNNVTWRNFNVVDMEPVMSSRGKYLALPFHVVGAWDAARRMTIEIGGRLPRSASLRLELPPGYVEAFRLRSKPGMRPDLPPLEPVQMPFTSGIEFPEVLIPKGIRIPLRLLVHVPRPYRNRTYEVFVRQLHHGNEVGRVTWRLKPRNP
jgi:serine protease